MSKQFLAWGVAIAALHAILALLYANATPFLRPGFLMNDRKMTRVFEGVSGDPVEIDRREVTSIERDGEQTWIKTRKGMILTAMPHEQVSAWWGRIPDVGAPDELQHVAYVRELAVGKLPLLDPTDPDLGTHYQSHQPPLFYALAVGWSKLFGTSQMGLRSLNVLIGAVTVLGVFFLGWWGTRRSEIAVGAAMFAALLPMNVALSGAVSNDPLLYCLCTWCLALTALYAREGLCLKRGLLLGSLVGAAFLTKTTALALVPAVLVGLALALKQPKLGSVIPGALLAITAGGLWWVRNLKLYGDPFAIKAFNVAFQNSPQAAGFIQAFGAQGYWVEWVGWWTFRSFVGTFGYMDVFLPKAAYIAFGAGFLLLLLLGLTKAFGPEEKENRWAHVTNLLFALVVLALFVQFNRQYFQGQARYLLPAIGPISVGIALGTAGWFRARPSIPISILATFMLGLNVFVLSSLPGAFDKRTAQTLPGQEASK